MNDVSIIMPSYNENHLIIDYIKSELESIGAEVIVVDDGSDDPYPNAIRHEKNLGYGAAIMTGIQASTRELILTADSDNQHRVSEIVKLYHAFKLIGNADMVVGTRRLGNENMVRFIGRKILNWTASLLCTYWLPDLNSGCRIFNRRIAVGYFPILCKQFSFTTSLTISMICDRYRVEFFPINVEPRTYGKTRVKLVKDGLVTLYYIFRNSFALRTRGIRSWIRKLYLR